jgi:hypothetical protein
MSGEIEALGGLVTAGLVADALETPGRIDAADVTADHGRCANCDAALHGNYCGTCGQKAHLHRSLIHVGEEFLHGITHFDGKTWQTLPMLLFKPGKLTREYIVGRRARYIAPVPLFLLVVFLMFFVFSFVSFGNNIGGGATDIDGKPMTQAEAKIELPRIEAELAKIDADIRAAEKDPEPGEIAALNGARVGVRIARDRVRARAAGRVDSLFDVPGALSREVDTGETTIDLGSESLNAKARKTLKNPELALYKVQSKAYKLSFLLVPLSLPWLWLMFAWKRGVRMYDHAIFALYSISFMSLLFVVGSVALTLDVGAPWFWGSLALAPLVHMYAQLKGAYALGRFGAAWRTLALSLASVITLSLYATLMIVIGVLD